MKAAVVTDFRAPCRSSVPATTSRMCSHGTPPAVPGSSRSTANNVNQAMADVLGGRVPARIVFQF